MLECGGLASKDLKNLVLIKVKHRKICCDVNVLNLAKKCPKFLGGSNGP